VGLADIFPLGRRILCGFAALLAEALDGAGAA